MHAQQGLRHSVDAKSGVAYIFLNRPAQRNALDGHFFTQFPLLMSAMDENQSVRTIILAGTGDHFCSGIDLSVLRSMMRNGSIAAESSIINEQGRLRDKLRRTIKQMQSAISAIESCRKPVIAAIHGACIGAGIDLICACDMRYCTGDSFFSVKEVDFAITADLGTLQRLPLLVGTGRASELVLTGRRFSALEAREIGLVQRVFKSRSEMQERVLEISADISRKSPLTVSGTKAVLLKSRDLSVDEGLDYVATWNSGTLLSDDLKEAISAYFEKRQPRFAKL